jgi:CDP-glucose 4,6-dehydratase
MHFLITGHTGFKGAWLSMLLKIQGHKVSGLALEPTSNSLYTRASLANIFSNDFRVDIDREIPKDVIKSNPDVLIHLAAQPLVKESYKNPVSTFQTNVIGTLNVLELTKYLELSSSLFITTDKVYKISDSKKAYSETDELGGNDPYSASKAAADIAIQSWRKSFTSRPVGIARAGNVIGGGDFAENRLLPDLVNSYSLSKPPVLRYPNSIRPWQHVLDCLNGYLHLIDFQATHEISSEWNFGPSKRDRHTVKEVAEKVGEQWGQYKNWQADQLDHEKETAFLMLNSEKSRKILKWKEKLDFEEAMNWTSKFYFDDLAGEDPRKLMENQINKFLAI